MFGGELVKSILDLMHEGLLVVDQSSVVRHVNPAACQLLACAAADLLDAPLGFPLPVEGVAGTITPPGGGHLSARVHTITWDDAPAYLIIVHRTNALSGQGRIDDKLDRLYRLAAQNLPDGTIVLLDHDRRCIALVGSVVPGSGDMPPPWAGRTLLEVAGPDTFAVVAPLYGQALDEGKEGECELEIDGRVYRLRIVPLFDERGQVLAAMGLSQDVTHYKQIEQETHRLNQELQILLAREQRARADEERYRALLQSIVEHSPAMMCVFRGPELRYEYANDNYARTVGRAADDLIGKPLLTVRPELATSGIYRALQEVYETGRPHRAAEMLVPVSVNNRGPAQEMYFTYLAQPLHEGDGTMNGVLLHAINVTDQVLARRELEEKGQQIAALNAALARQVKELADANRELEAFTHSVSHDLRGPLRRIDGFGHMLLERHAGGLDEQGRLYLSRIRAAAQHMSVLIDDLLSLSLVSRLELETHEVDLGRVASEIFERLREQAPDRQVSLRLGAGLCARGDARLLRIALENLLENAWKFTGKKDAATIELDLSEHQGERVFHVRDNGAGFDPAYSGKLFDAFSRLHSPAEFPGTGVGLATVKRVIERHGGRIWAESSVGQGATFYFTLSGPADRDGPADPSGP